MTKKGHRQRRKNRNGWHFVHKNGSIIKALGKSENASTQKCRNGRGMILVFRRGITWYHLYHFVGLLWNLGDGIYIFLHVALEQDVESFKKDSCFSFCNDNNIVLYNTIMIQHIYNIMHIFFTLYVYYVNSHFGCQIHR